MISVFFSNNVLLFYTSEHIKDAPLYSIKQNQNLCLTLTKTETLKNKISEQKTSKLIMYCSQQRNSIFHTSQPKFLPKCSSRTSQCVI